MRLSHTLLWEAVELQKCLLLCRSITHAQRMSAALERVGVRAWITRPPLGLTNKGCGYAVRISALDQERAMRELSLVRLLPERVFLVTDDGGYREIYLR